jgi:hypothetical protein
MNKEIIKLYPNLYEIISEPGDCTRYNYFVWQFGDDFRFMSKTNTFNYPRNLNYWDIKDLTKEEIHELAKKENCNYHTLQECLRAIKELIKYE